MSISVSFFAEALSRPARMEVHANTTLYVRMISRGMPPVHSNTASGNLSRKDFSQPYGQHSNDRHTQSEVPRVSATTAQERRY
jgi:hypothetical protein